MNLPLPTFSGITLLGLGTGDASGLTRQAWDALQNAGEVYLRTRRHPAVVGFSSTWVVHDFDELFAGALEPQALQAQIVQQVLALGRRPQGVIYAVPGHPLVAEATCAALQAQASADGVPLRVIAGLGFTEPVLGALELVPPSRLHLIDALELAGLHVPSFPPDAPALITHLHSVALAATVQKVLLTVYPPEHLLHLAPAAGAPQTVPLAELAHSAALTQLNTLYLPALGPGTAFEGFQEVIAHLRAPEGCPWDREQTHLSLRPYLLQETYEVLDALDAEDAGSLKEELGDLLLQIVLHAQIATEAGHFRMADVINAIHTKLVHRHPHVFSDTQVGGVGDVLQNWEKLKAVERQKKGKEKNSALDGLPKALPALVQATEYQQRVVRFGFQWQNTEQVFDKIQEEIIEVQQAETTEERAAEIGDLLMAVVSLARWYDVEPESALRATSARFRCRFQHLEEAARQQGRPLAELPIAEMLSLWEQAKPGCE